MRAGNHLWTIWLVAGWAALWGWADLLRSDRFVVPVSYRIEDGRITFVRELPFGPVIARTHSEILSADGYHCQQPDEWTMQRFQVAPRNTVSRATYAWMNECLEREVPHTVGVTIQVRLLDLVWLRPAYFDAEVTP